MAHSGGFEPPTARFVAEYSIQLSYECVGARILCIWPGRVKRLVQIIVVSKIGLTTRPLANLWL